MAASCRNSSPPTASHAVARLVLASAFLLACALPHAGAQDEDRPAAGVREETPTYGEEDKLTVPRVYELLRSGTSPAIILARIKRSGGEFSLTVEDVIRLRKAGATPDLVLAMARPQASAAAQASLDAGQPDPDADEDDDSLEESMPPAEQGPRGTLSIRQVLRMQRKGAPIEEIIARVAREGLKQPPDLDVLLSLHDEGIPDDLILALARGRSPSAGNGTTPLATTDVIAMLDAGIPQDEVVAAIEERGLIGPPALDEALALRGAGAGEEVIAAINRAGLPPPVVAADVIAVPAAEAPLSRSLADHVPSAEARDRLWVASVPTGSRVYVSPARARGGESFNHDYYVGLTPLSLTLDPGEYQVTVAKDPSAFDDSLLPAWQTVHDLEDTRTVLDNADLAFDPSRCCLPGSLSGRADTYPIARQQARSIIGDHFQGLPPYLFDNESVQILSVSDARITQVVKEYTVRKNAGQARTVVALFIPAEGDPLDPSDIDGLPPGNPYDGLVDAPALAYLGDPGGRQDFAAAMGVSPGHVADAVAMLRRAGKAIIHQQVPGGVRLVTLMVDDGGRLRLTDKVLRPSDPLAIPPDPESIGKGKKKIQAPPPQPPSLPGVSRTVEPGLGLPRLTVTNGSSTGVGLVFDDGQFCYVAAGDSAEFEIDPGTYLVRLLGTSPDVATPQGRLHFSYHARYAMTF